MSEKLLTKPARVHHTIFPAGVPERMVIECAQRHYEWRQNSAPMGAKQVEDLGRLIQGARQSQQEIVPEPLHPAAKRRLGIDESALRRLFKQWRTKP